MVFSNEEAVDMIHLIKECEDNFRQCERLWRERFPDRFPHSRHVFSRLLKRLKNEGNCQPHHNKGRQISRSVRDVKVIDILASIEINPHDSLRRRGNDSGVSRATIALILKDNNFRPYKMIAINKLLPADPQSRLNFCHWIRQQPRDFHQKILFTDECTFKSDREVNPQNYRYWSQENPAWTREVDHQRIWKVNVWCGIINNQILGPIFFEGNLNGNMYAQFIERDLPVLMENIPEELRQDLWFQQDGCPAHTSRVSREKIDALFPDKWIGKYGPVNYPPRSPDLTVLDYYLWGRIKDLVYRECPSTRENMQNRIRDAIQSLSADEILKAVNHFVHAVENCIQNNGAQFEHE